MDLVVLKEVNMCGKSSTIIRRASYVNGVYFIVFNVRGECVVKLFDVNFKEDNYIYRMYEVDDTICYNNNYYTSTGSNVRNLSNYNAIFTLSEFKYYKLVTYNNFLYIFDIFGFMYISDGEKVIETIKVMDINPRHNIKILSIVYKDTFYVLDNNGMLYIIKNKKLWRSLEVSHIPFIDMVVYNEHLYIVFDSYDYYRNGLYIHDLTGNYVKTINLKHEISCLCVYRDLLVIGIKTGTILFLKDDEIVGEFHFNTVCDKVVKIAVHNDQLSIIYSSGKIVVIGDYYPRHYDGIPLEKKELVFNWRILCSVAIPRIQKDLAYLFTKQLISLF